MDWRNLGQELSRTLSRRKLEFGTVNAVGVWFYAVDTQRYLYLLRDDTRHPQTWGLPGGKLDLMETLEDCAKREVLEECNLVIHDLSYIGITNNIMEDLGLHYITIYFSTTTYYGKLDIMEKDKCSEWNWFSEKKLPPNLFEPLKNYYEKLYRNEL